MSAYVHLLHTNAPVWDEACEILILGTFPSVKSRESGFYYGHPQNRFWRVLSSVLACPLPLTVEEKKHMLLSHHIALWDVIAECDILGSSDSSIRNVRPNDVRYIVEHAPIGRIFVNGATSDALYRRYIFPDLQMPAIRLPSTSPANAAWTLDRLCEAWRIVVTG